ncbi:MAG: hypothetical protein ACREX8_19730 [Gammaproteobacteria bacterium]
MTARLGSAVLDPMSGAEPNVRIAEQAQCLNADLDERGRRGSLGRRGELFGSTPEEGLPLGRRDSQAPASGQVEFSRGELPAGDFMITQRPGAKRGQQSLGLVESFVGDQPPGVLEHRVERGVDLAVGSTCPAEPL